MFAFVNEHFVEEHEAAIGINDLALQRGYGVFDFFRTKNFMPLFVDDYLERLFYSAEKFRLTCPFKKDTIKNIINELIRRNDIETSGIRIILTGGYSEDSYQIAEPNFIMTQKAIELPTEEKYQQGYKILTHKYQREIPDAKSINYLMGIYLQQKLADEGCDDVLYTNNENILEFPRANVFIVTKDDKVITPGSNVLEGITRKKVLELARKNYIVEERNVSIDELNNAAEIFLTSTTKRLLPVLEINGQQIGSGSPGKITDVLYRLFLQMEEE